MPIWAIRALAGLGLVAAVWLHGCHHGKGLERASHAAVLADIAAKTARSAAKAKTARDLFESEKAADLKRHAEEKADAFEAGRSAAAGIRDGSVRVRTVWRECPAAVPGPGAEPAGGDFAVPEGRADAIGRILGRGWGWDADYGLAYARLTRAQDLLNACYEQPAQP